MVEISRNKPSNLAALMTPNDLRMPDIYSLDDGEIPFREIVNRVQETPKKADVKKGAQSHVQLKKTEPMMAKKNELAPFKTIGISNFGEGPKKEEILQEAETLEIGDFDSLAKTKEVLQDLGTIAISDFDPLSKKEEGLQELEMIQPDLFEQNITEEVTGQGVDPGFITENREKVLPIALDQGLTVEENLENALSDLELIENPEDNSDIPVGFYTVEHYTKDLEKQDEQVGEDQSEGVLVSPIVPIDRYQPITVIVKTQESIVNDAPQNSATNFNIQSVQSGDRRENMHEGSERHVVVDGFKKTTQEIKLSSAEQKVVDAFVNLKTGPVKVEPDSFIKISSPQEVSSVEMKRLFVVPMQLIENPQNKSVHANLTLDTHSLEPSSIEITKVDKCSQESMNFSQFFGSSSDIKNMSEINKVVTHNLVSANPAAEFIETLKQNFRQFGKMKTSKLTVQMRYSGKNLTIHFNTDSNQVMNVTFRTADHEWRQMLQTHAKKIEHAFESANHIVKIKYLGE
jgi:hypothetical protein